MYDYKEVIKNDVLEYINDEINLADFNEWEDLQYLLESDLYNHDGITGNGSGSYTFSTYEAEENIAHNLDLLGDALVEFGYSSDYLFNEGAEAADVLIRCYLLNDCISEAIEELSWIDNDVNSTFITKASPAVVGQQLRAC